jgi:virulence-associated protein VagC
MYPLRTKAVRIPATIPLPEGIVAETQIEITGADGGSGKPLIARTVVKSAEKE